MNAFEFVVTHDTKLSGPGFEVYAADVLAFSPYGGPGTVLDHVEVTLATDTVLPLFTAAAVAEEQFISHGFTVVDHITSYGSHGKGQMGRAL